MATKFGRKNPWPICYAVLGSKAMQGSARVISCSRRDIMRVGLLGSKVIKGGPVGWNIKVGQYIKIWDLWSLYHGNILALQCINATDHVAIANAINMHLASFSNSQKPLDMRELRSYLPSQEPPPLVHTWEIYDDLRKLSASKAGGPDGIPQSCWRNLHMGLVVLWLI